VPAAVFPHEDIVVAAGLPDYRLAVGTRRDEGPMRETKLSSTYELAIPSRPMMIIAFRPKYYPEFWKAGDEDTSERT
jgi:hypothetical protein